jgi:hypothetical protein
MRTDSITRSSGDASKMESIISRVQVLGASADFWSSVVNVMLFFTAVVAILYFLATIRHSQINKQLRVAQENLSKAKDIQLALDIAKVKADAETESKRIETEAKIRIAEVEAGAETKIADAKKEASEASERAGKANERAGSLEHATELLRKGNIEAAAKLEEEKSKRIELAVSLLPRVFRDQSGAIMALKMFPNITARLEYLADSECLATAEQINFVLRQVGWTTSGKPGNDMLIRGGVNIFPNGLPPTTGNQSPDIEARQLFGRNLDDTRAAAEALKDELIKSGIEANVHDWILPPFDIPRPPRNLIIWVGTHPNRILEKSLEELGPQTPPTPINEPNFRLTFRGVRTPFE